MPYSTRTYSGSPRSSDYLPPGLKWLLITNIAFFVVNYFAVLYDFQSLFTPFALIPAWVLKYFAVWQLFTYLFLHNPFGFGHIFFNMLFLWMFGATLERTWGTRHFLRYYFLCGVGAGICVVLANLLFNRAHLDVPTIGASGAIYGLLLAFGILFPETVFLVMFVVPVKAKYLVLIVGSIEFLSTFSVAEGGVSHVAHLGGMLFGFLYLRGLFDNIPNVNPAAAARTWYRDYKYSRARKKFEVFVKKRQSDQDNWVN